MKSVDWGADFNLLYARYFSKYVVDGKEYAQTLNNFKYTNIINPNNDFTIGNTCASSVTFSIFKPEISLENREITIYEGVNSGSGIDYIKIGTFTITKQESDGEYTKYTGYDAMYKADKGYFSELSYPTTDKAILEEICLKLGINLATPITTTHSIEEKPQGYTMREMIGYMAMLQGSNAVINSDGNLALKWYTDSGYVLNGHQYYQQGVTFTTSKDFTIQKLTCNNTKSGDKETSTITSGSGATGLSFANPFMTQTNLDEVFNKIGGFTFRPITVKFVGDWRIEVGDIIAVNKDGKDYKVPVMQIVHECDGGLMDSITSIGQSDTENSNVASGPITKQMGRYYADLVLLNKAIVNKLDVDEARINYATIKDLNATKAAIDELDANKLSASYAEIINANVESLKSVNAEIISLKANSLTADIADLKYAQIDFANVKGQVIGTSLIKDGAVTNEKVQSLSANKLTAGTIDASKITVTNLNADNLTVGTINGKLIGNSSVTLDKLAEEVPTKEYLDKVQEELQGQIDGQIETFTVSEIPTLNNAPVDTWGEQIYPSDDLYPSEDLRLTLDLKVLDKHIGDICYVINPASSADGFSYRFANTGTLTAPNYEWVLIKDSDVTKALQDIININGEITGIKSFNVEISSWKTDTDEELSSLKMRTTTLETDIGNKVETTVFNEVKQTVDENSSSITKMSETLSKKADNSTVETINTTVNDIKQTVDANTSSISSLTNIVSKKADGSTVTALQSNMTALTADLSGFKTTVSSTYSTKTEFNNLQIGGRNLVLNSYPNETSNAYGFASRQLAVQLEAGVTYTVSANGRVIDGNGVLAVYIHEPSWKNSAHRSITSKVDTTISFTFTPTISGTYVVQAYSYLSGGVHGGNVHINWYKVEKGNKATDWTPAPEDIDEKFTDYSTTTQVNSAINQSASSILASVSSTYATKASLELKVDKNKLISEINASADVITLKSNRFVLDSTNAKIAADGTVNFVQGTIAGWNISSAKLSGSAGLHGIAINKPVTSSTQVISINHIDTTAAATYVDDFYVRADGYTYIPDGYLSTKNHSVGGKGIEISGSMIKFFSWTDKDNFAGGVWSSYIDTGDSGGAQEKRQSLVVASDFNDELRLCYGNQDGKTYTAALIIDKDHDNKVHMIKPTVFHTELQSYNDENYPVTVNSNFSVGKKGTEKIARFWCYNGGSTTKSVRIFNAGGEAGAYLTNCEFSLWGTGSVKYNWTVNGNIYGNVSSDSDKNIKKDIRALDIEDSAQFIYSLIPSEFRFKNGTSNRLHHGLIAQEVKESMGDSDWGLFIDKKVDDENYNEIAINELTGEQTQLMTARYSLRYDELIADLIATVQSLNNRLKALEK